MEKNNDAKSDLKDVVDSPVAEDLHTDNPSKNANIGNNPDGNEKRENTRSTMAILFVLGFFAILFLCFVYAIMVDASLGELKDALIGIAGALSGTLGFIVGYYYKSTLEQ